MIEADHPDISIRRQCELIGLNRSNYYYQAKNKISDEDIEIMNLIDQYYTKHPFTGTRKMKKYLNKQGYRINRKRVQRLYREMGLEAIYPKPNLSKPHPGHKIYPYLLKGVTINRTNQVWSTDITYLKLEKGYAYLTAIIDWHSRYVLSWTISSTLEAEVCVDLLKETIVKYGTCEIFNTDHVLTFESSFIFKKYYPYYLLSNILTVKACSLRRYRWARSLRFHCFYLKLTHLIKLIYPTSLAGSTY